MRDIKFRAWNGGEMYYDVFLCDKEDYKVYQEKENGAITGPYGSCPEVMQYTGIKDKNGKEVYEGDILDMFPTHEKKIYDTIIFSEGCFCLKDAMINYELTYGLGDAIVIGNIYSNPDLLREST